LTPNPTSGIAAGEHWERKLNEAANGCGRCCFSCPRRGWGRTSAAWNSISPAGLNKRLFGILIGGLIRRTYRELTDEWQIISIASGTDGVTCPLIPITHEVVGAHLLAGGLQQLKHRA
jgi:hypothetical protein